MVLDTEKKDSRMAALQRAVDRGMVTGTNTFLLQFVVLRGRRIHFESLGSVWCCIWIGR